MKPNNALALVALLGVVCISVFWYVRKPGSPISDTTERDEAAAVVENFGHVLKNISLLAPTAAQDIDRTYKPFLTPELLAQWEANPSLAVGRRTSSPWPVRIEVHAIQKTAAERYDITGTLVEVTSDNQQDGTQEPIHLEVVKQNGKWLIAQVEAPR